jgi:drug/metabolite transporter (DMT)-like permease
MTRGEAGQDGTRERRRAFAMLLLANVFWGLSFPLIKTVTQLNARLFPAAGGGFIVGLVLAPRFLLGLLVLLAWPARGTPGTRWLAGPEIRQGIWLGLFGGAGLLLQSDGLRFTAASTSAFLTQFYAIMIPVWLALRLRRAPPPAVWLACALVLAGVALLGHFDWRQMRAGRGEVETLLSSVFFMVQILMLGSPRHAANRPGKVTLVWFAVEAVLFGGLALATAPTVASLLAPWACPAWLGCTLLLASFCTVGAFVIMIRWQPKVTTTEAGLMYCFEPIFGAVFALCLPAILSRWSGISYANETATLSLLVGGGLITVANAVVQLQPEAAAE